MRKNYLPLLALVLTVVLLSGTALAKEEYLVPYAGGRVTVDGDMSDWLGVPTVTIEDESASAGPVDFLLQWDHEYLYVLAIADDAVPYNVHSGGDIWQGDSLQIALDADNSQSFGYDGGDYEYGWAQTSRGPEQTYWHLATGVVYDSDSFLVSIRRVQSSRRGNPATVNEIGIPAAMLVPMELEEGAVVGFNILVNNDDGQGRDFVEWSEGIGFAKNPSQFNSIRLVR